MSRASELARLLESEVEDANHFRNEAAAELRRLERVNAELVEAMRQAITTFSQIETDAHAQDVLFEWWGAFSERLADMDAALTSATKEQQK